MSATFLQSPPSSEQLAHLGTLTSSLAHELRNPLNAIKANLQLMEEDMQRVEDGDGPHGRRVRRVLSEVERLDRILTGFLAVVRGDELHVQRCDLGALLRDVISLITPQADAAGVSILMDANIALEAVVDAEALKQALLNLALNGLQAMTDDAGRACAGATLMLRLEAGVMPSPSLKATSVDSAKSDEPSAIIDVIDTGRGIDAEYLDHVFELFYTTRDGGSGIGLAVVARVVKAHGGVVTVESEVGKGTHLRIWLPIAPSSDAPSSDALSSDAPSSDAAPSVAGKNSHG